MLDTLIPHPMLALIVERFPDEDLDGRWYLVTNTWLTSDPMIVLPRFVAERTAVMLAAGSAADHIEATAREWITRPEIATLCRELGELHGVSYGPTWLRRACRQAFAEAMANPPELVGDSKDEIKHLAVMWAMLACFTEPGE